MLALLLFFLLLLCPCLPLCLLTQRRFEEVLPVSAALLVLPLFALGLVGLLPWGLPLLGVLALGALVWGLLLWRRRPAPRRAGAARVFSPAFFLFTALFFYFAALDYGRLAWEFDALSHWADVVKAMVQLGVLSVSPLSRSTFQSYPPGLSLFQYLEEALAVRTGGGYADWRLYHAFQVFVLCFLFPGMARLDFRRVSGWLGAAALLLAPCCLFSGVYGFLYVDPVLGILAGSGLCQLLLEERRDGFFRARLLLTLALLVLVKDAGAFYALTLTLLYLIAELLPDGRPFAQRLREKRARLLCAVAAPALLLALWKLAVRLSGAAVAYPDPVSLGELLRLLSFRDHSYRAGIRDSLWMALLENGSGAAVSGIGLTYLVLIVLLFAGLLWVLKAAIRRFPQRAALLRWAYWLKLAELGLYLLALLILYCFKFSPYEGQQLASLSRYLAVPLLSVWLTVLAAALELLRTGRRDRDLGAALLLCLVLLCTPPESLIQLTNRGQVAQSVANRAPITQLEQRVRALVPAEEARIYFISQEDTEYPLYMTKYSLRPLAVSAPLGWSLGESFYEGDVWTRACAPEALRETLLADYDYLLIHRVNEAFAVRYAALFADPAEIAPDSLYAVDRAAGTLRRLG